MASEQKGPEMKPIHSLSLLSRGNGQVVQSKQKKLEVYLEPEDYLNWMPQDKALIRRSQDGAQITWWGSLPKTYSTRKGVLILYSEDFAEPSWKQEGMGKRPRPSHRRKKSCFVLHTLKDLTTAILAYGSEGKDQKNGDWQPYLHFLSKPEQQIRPGYSAKRYLLSLFRNWAPGTLYKLQRSGYIRDPRLFQDNQLFLPNHIRRQQDLSAVPSKYHLLPVYPSVSAFWTQKEQLADEDEEAEAQLMKCLAQICRDKSDFDNEESEDSDMEKEDSRVEKYWEEKAPLPPLRRKPPGRAPWLDEAAYAEDMWMEAHQGTQALKKSQKGCRKFQPPLGSNSVLASLDLSQFPSPRSHSTFYGGTFPDRKTYLSGNMKISKNRHQMFPELPTERCVLPPVQPAISPEQNLPVKVKNKKLPKALKLPPITEELPRAQDPQKSLLNDYGIPEELLILPLEVRLYAEPKDRGQRGGNDFFQPPVISREIKRSGIKSGNIQQKISGARNPKDLMDDGISESGRPEELIGSSQDPALGNILMGPAGDIVCQPLLGSVQSMDLPLQLDLASGEDSSTNLGEECSSNQHVRKGASEGFHHSQTLPPQLEQYTEFPSSQRIHTFYVKAINKASQATEEGHKATDQMSEE